MKLRKTNVLFPLEGPVSTNLPSFLVKSEIDPIELGSVGIQTDPILNK